MIAVIFEVLPGEHSFDAYLEHAARLRPLLDAADGFHSIERFQSLSHPGKLVSLSFWRDEGAVRCWREHPEHRATQAAARAGGLADYRLRVAEVRRDYGMYVRSQAPEGHATVAGSCPLVPS